MATTSGTLYKYAWYPSTYCGGMASEMESWCDWWINRDDPSSQITVHVTRLRGHLYGERWSGGSGNNRLNYWGITWPSNTGWKICGGLDIRNNRICGSAGACWCNIDNTWTGDSSAVISISGSTNHVHIEYAGLARNDPYRWTWGGDTVNGDSGNNLSAAVHLSAHGSVDIPIPTASAPTITIGSGYEMGEPGMGDTTTWATVNWISSTRGNYSKVSKVELLVGTSTNPTQVVASRNFNTTSSTSGTMTWNGFNVGPTTYYYRFRITNSNGLTGLSAIKSFTTPDYIPPDPPVPPPPVLRRKIIKYRQNDYQLAKYKELEYMVEPVSTPAEEHHMVMQTVTKDKNVFAKTIDTMQAVEGIWYI